MLRIRLKRVGRKHDPSYRIIVTEKGRSPQTGRYVENLGSYDARSDKIAVDTERAAYWVGVGAQPSETVHNILVEVGVIDGEKVNPLPQKSPVTSQEAPEEQEEPESEEDESAKSDEEESDGEEDAATEEEDSVDESEGQEEATTEDEGEEEKDEEVSNDGDTEEESEEDED